MKNNNLLCDPVTGICEINPGDNSPGSNEILPTSNKPVSVVYFTDPICSSCWGIEPSLRKLKLEYGNVLEMEYHMGGLLPDWSYNSGGISKPSDVAHHWDEVSGWYDMPIDGDIWLEDPLSSSYPPSIACKAAALQGHQQAIAFLREIREMVFLKKKNITRWEYLEEAAQLCGLDIVQFKSDYESRANKNFHDDLEYAKQNGVSGFPTLFFSNSRGEKVKIYGVKPYALFENTILQLHPAAVKNEYDKSWKNLFAVYSTLTAHEFSVLSEIKRSAAEALLNQLTIDQELVKFTTKNGSIWKKKL